MYRAFVSSTVASESSRRYEQNGWILFNIQQQLCQKKKRPSAQRWTQLFMSRFFMANVTLAQALLLSRHSTDFD